ncbi:MAG: hypothetical protein L6Q84_17650 [Polyangiaceae bacterium]|nr:hypothetical protein [Polyangiaceae bacterium]
MLGRALLGLCLLALGCDGGAAGDAAGAGGAAGGSAACSNDAGPGSVCVQQVTGRTVDASGQALAKLSTSVCGSVCWFGESDATGAFSVSIGERIVPSQFSVLTHGRPSHTSFYFPLPESPAPSVDMGELTLLALPPSGPELVVWSDKQGAPAQTVTSGGLTLELTAGTQIKLDVEDVALGNAGKQFRVTPIPAALQARFAPPALGLLALWALGPFEAAIILEAGGASALARISSADVLGLAPGTPVEWLALGSYLFSDWVAPATFGVVATGQVSPDGLRIEMNAGEGTRYLTWIGVRKKP